LDKPRSVKTLDFFKTTFSKYLINKNYREKIKESEAKNAEEYKLFFEEQLKILENQGFKSVISLF